MNVSVCPLQPPPADLDSLFLYVEDVMDVSSRLLSLLDQQQQLAPGDPLYLQTLCETLEDVSPLIGSVFVLLQAVSSATRDDDVALFLLSSVHHRAENEEQNLSVLHAAEGPAGWLQRTWLTGSPVWVLFCR